MEVLREMLKRHEGYRDKVYLDSEGFPTVGYGHHLYPGSRISCQIAELLLDMDLADTVNEFMKLSPNRIKKLNMSRRRIIMDMIFNMGLQRVLAFKKMWEAIDREDWETAANEMLDSKWAKQVKGRADELSEIMRKGV
jgi:lysozyme